MAVTMLFLNLIVIPVSAHGMTAWRNYYHPDNAGGTYHFGFINDYHMNSRSFTFFWRDSETENRFSTALISGGQSSGNIQGWDGMIHGTRVNTNNAHVIIEYAPKKRPNDYTAAETELRMGDGHIRTNWNDAIIYLYVDTPQPGDHVGHQRRLYIMTHEIGHMFGLGDIARNLSSIYASPPHSSYAQTITRHDKNAMYIGLNNPWYLGIDNSTWYRQKSPGVWAKNEFMVIDGHAYYFKSDEKMTTGWWAMNGSLYYFRRKVNGSIHPAGVEGAMVAGGTFTIDGTQYRFDSVGRLII